MKKEIMLTGGGKPNFPPPGALQGQVEILLGPTLDGLENPFDSDARFSQQSVTNGDPIIVDEVECLNTDDLNIGCSLVQQKELVDIAGVLKLTDSESSKSIPEIAVAGPLGTSKSEEVCSKALENKENKMWNGWSPAALKTKLSESLNSKKSSPWLQRRRPKASLHDKCLESKLELVELMKKNLESEAKYKRLLFEEQLKQEKTKTTILELQLKEKEEELNLRKH